MNHDPEATPIPTGTTQPMSLADILTALEDDLAKARERGDQTEITRLEREAHVLRKNQGTPPEEDDGIGVVVLGGGD